MLIGVTLVVSIVSSLGAPLIPAVAEALDVSLDSAHWSLTAALLAGAVAAPIMGRLGDGPYRREVIIGGLAVVLVGSIIAGVAQSLAVLIAGRAMQGIGLGLAPITMAAARDHLPADRSPAVIGVLSVTGAAGVGAGYPISGLIAGEFGVHGAFLFGGVVSGFALVAALAVIPSSRESSRVPLDATGAVVLAAGLVALLLAIGQGEAWGWGSPVIVGLFAAAILILGLWVGLQLTRHSPLVDVRQLRHRPVLTADLVAIMLGAGALHVPDDRDRVRPDAGERGLRLRILDARRRPVPRPLLGAEPHREPHDGPDDAPLRPARDAGRRSARDHAAPVCSSRSRTMRSGRRSRRWASSGSASGSRSRPSRG